MKDKLVLPCLRYLMGDWVIYSSVMSAHQVHDRITTDKKYRENSDLDNILQRGLKERKIQIAKYLLTTDSRFFNSIIVGVFGGMPQWHEFSIEKKVQEINSRSDSQTAEVGLLEFIGDEEMFAIDGQHRVAGIQIAFEEELEKHESERVLKDDRFPIIFVAHIDDELGKKRTRKLFSDINKNAKKVEEGDTIKIDEEDLAAIVTRRLYATYPFFKDGSIISLSETAKLESSDKTNFTNLLGLNTATKQLKSLYRKEKKTNTWDEVNVKNLYSISQTFWDIVISDVSDYRNFFIEKTLTIEDARKDNKHLLFRPIGLKLLSKLFVFFYKKYNKSTIEFIEKISKIEFTSEEDVLSTTIWNSGKIITRNFLMSYRLTLYVLDEYDGDEDGLLKAYRDLMKDDTIELPDKIIR